MNKEIFLSMKKKKTTNTFEREKKKHLWLRRMSEEIVEENISHKKVNFQDFSNFSNI
jgi:hypothetical protein